MVGRSYNFAKKGCNLDDILHILLRVNRMPLLSKFNNPKLVQNSEKIKNNVDSGGGGGGGGGGGSIDINLSHFKQMRFHFKTKKKNKKKKNDLTGRRPFYSLFDTKYLLFFKAFVSKGVLNT